MIHLRDTFSAAAKLGFLLVSALGLSCGEFRNAQPEPLTNTSRAGSGGSGSGTTSGPGSGGDQSGSGSGGGSGGGESGQPCSTTGATRCASGAPVVEVCTVDGRWVVKANCSAICTLGSCAGKCKPGDKQCGMAQFVETCNDNGDWIPAAEACPNVCSGQGQCGGDCPPGSKKCGGDKNLTPFVCDENGKWNPKPDCPNLCSSGACGGSCMPGAKNCGANNTPATCSAMGTFEPALAPCDFVCVGDGKCGGECKPGSKQCAAQIVQICDDTGMYRNTETCSFLCDKGICAGACKPGERRCGQNNTPDECSPMGVWAAQAPCDFVCQGQGMCGGVCKPGAKKCSGNAVATCRTDGSGFDDKPCGGECPVCQAGSCKDNKVTCYQDGDGDGYGDKGSSKTMCGSCGSSGGQKYVSNNDDCYDKNKLAHPGAGAQDHDRGDGSFDYNCKNGEEKEMKTFTNKPCESHTVCGSGMQVPTPGCGQSYMVITCTPPVLTGDPNTTTDCGEDTATKKVSCR